MTLHVLQICDDGFVPVTVTVHHVQHYTNSQELSVALPLPSAGYDTDMASDSPDGGCAMARPPPSQPHHEQMYLLQPLRLNRRR